MTSFDESPHPSSNIDSSASIIRERNTSPTYSSEYIRPKPQRSTNGRQEALNGNPATSTHHRTDTGGSSSSRGIGDTRPRRTRTYSQPYAYDGSSQGQNGHANGLPTPESSRSTSPQYNQQQLQGRTSDVKPTRIPVVARGRTPSTSSHGTATYNGRTSDASRHGNGNGPYGSPAVGTQPELWSVEESDAPPSNHSQSTVSVPSRQRSGILNEPAPFTPGPSYSGNQHDVHPDQAAFEEEPVLPRASTDSEERPFEHWYRGDIYRNGGVGELRVGAKQEMLDIANYGHQFGGRSKPASSTRAPSTSRGTPVTEDFPSRRKRAESVAGIGGRESFYMDEERAKELANVLNEDPLTDLEGDGDQDTSNSFTEYERRAAVNGFSSSTPPSGMGSSARSSPDDHRSITPTTNMMMIERERNAPQTRIPAPAPRQSSEPPQAQTSTQPHSSNRGGSEPPTTFPASSSSTSAPGGRSPSIPSLTTPPQAQSTKRRGKSPAAPAPKKPKTKMSKSPARSKAEDEKNRRSVAVYPEPTGENMMDAIPSWTQPVPNGGNWDEVVLPVVARKRGLDGHYEQADGSVQHRKPEPERIEPVRNFLSSRVVHILIYYIGIGSGHIWI